VGEIRPPEISMFNFSNLGGVVYGKSRKGRAVAWGGLGTKVLDRG